MFQFQYQFNQGPSPVCGIHNCRTCTGFRGKTAACSLCGTHFLQLCFTYCVRQITTTANSQAPWQLRSNVTFKTKPDADLRYHLKIFEKQFLAFDITGMALLIPQGWAEKMTISRPEARWCIHNAQLWPSGSRRSWHLEKRIDAVRNLAGAVYLGFVVADVLCSTQRNRHQWYMLWSVGSFQRVQSLGSLSGSIFYF